MSARGSTGLWIVIGLGLTLVMAANAHLVFVAINSEPACVPHARIGTGHGSHHGFAAAQSACAPSVIGDSP